ncbi:hypothetical protein, partial [Arachidicoccus sp.]|uniref:hypothetical protein n=1 Tax=Arachidicoccus sp. TaxID=1872624 RepID=UPI003D1EAECA
RRWVIIPEWGVSIVRIYTTDYLDSLDCGCEPIDGSQYYVAPFVQDFIDLKIANLHPELKQYLIDNNRYSMKIE